MMKTQWANFPPKYYSQSRCSRSGGRSQDFAVLQIFPNGPIGRVKCREKLSMYTATNEYSKVNLKVESVGCS